MGYIVCKIGLIVIQGRNDFTPKMLYQVHLDTLVPADNFYRPLDATPDFHFIYNETKKYYGTEGQESIEQVVYFKIMLVGYSNNINNDRALLRYCSNCLDVHLFLRYDIDEDLLWYSTISCTCQLYGEDVFLALFKKVLSMCIDKGMVRGKRQEVDSAYIKANASMDSLVEKEVIENNVEDYAKEFNDNSHEKIDLSNTKNDIAKKTITANAKNM